MDKVGSCYTKETGNNDLLAPFSCSKGFGGINKSSKKTFILVLLTCLVSLLLVGCTSQPNEARNSSTKIVYKRLVDNIFSGDSFTEQYAIPIAFGINNDKIFYYTYTWDTEKPLTFNYYLIEDGTHHQLLEYSYQNVFGRYHMNMDLFKKGEWSNNGQYLAFIADFEMPKILFIYNLKENTVEITKDVNDFNWVGNRLVFSKIQSYLGNDEFKLRGYTTYDPETKFIQNIEENEEFVAYEKYKNNNEVMFSNDYKYVLLKSSSSSKSGSMISFELGEFFVTDR